MKSRLLSLLREALSLRRPSSFRGLARRCIEPWIAAVAIGLAALAATVEASAATGDPQLVSHGQFTDVEVYRPRGAIKDFVVLLSEGDALSAAERQLAVTMSNAGAMVAAVPLPPFYRKAESRTPQCVYAGGDFENLSRYVQAFDKLPTYIAPMVVGSGAAAAFAYAVVAQSPAGTFSAALTMNFCPRIELKTPPCASNALRWQAAGEGKAGVELQPAAALGTPWTALQTNGPAACPAADAQAFVARVPPSTWLAAAPAAARPGSTAASAAPATATATAASAAAPGVPAGFESAYAKLAAQRVPLGHPPAQLAGLPIVEATVENTASTNKRFAVMISGDGGWAGIDKGIAAAFVKQGVPVAGLDSLRYFWSARTPQGLADDLDRIIRFYAARWKRSEVILIGYSQGADVMPFAVNRLPPRSRSGVKLIALLGLGQKASFEFHVTNWIGPSGDIPIEPEARKLVAANTLCVYGSDEKNSLCPVLAPVSATALSLPGGHHFGGDYDGLAMRILEAIPADKPVDKSAGAGAGAR